MCGIIGGLHPQASEYESQALSMLEQIRYRGPDAGYLHLDLGFFLGLRRLSIVNVAAGRQPTVSADGQVMAVFNGEIYNHAALREELTRDGYAIRDGSDAEVIPHAYLKWGTDFANHFNGDFAIALFDKRKQELVLTRDRLGIKPLYFTRAKDRLYFASEIKSLLVNDGVPRQLNHGYLAQLFTFWTGLDGGSPFLGIDQVEAGTVLTFDATGKQQSRRKYWDIPARRSAPRFEADFDDCKTAFRNELRKSIQLRLQADVEVGTYTSGGIDSSVVNVMAYEDLQHSGRQTFSVGFEDQTFDESSYQSLLAEQLDLRTNSIRCDANAIYENFLKVIFHTESPVFRTAPVPMFMLSDLVSKRGVKVVLTGEGADEVAWGYDIFREAKIRRFWSRQPNSKTRPRLFEKLYAYLPQFQDKRHVRLLADFFRRNLSETDSPLYSHHTRIANSTAVQVFLSDQMKERIAQDSPSEALIRSLPDDFPSRSPMEKCQYLEMRTLLQGYLLSSQGDRMLSAHGVEGRFPYLDHHVIEFLAGVPERYKLRGLFDKTLLRESFRNDLPPSIFERPKFAFRAPEVYAFVNDANGIVEQHLNEDRIKAAGIFDPSVVRRLLVRLARTDSARFSTRDNLAFVQILSTQMLHGLFVERFDIKHGPTDDVTITRFDDLEPARGAA